jgi:hypothetical protein
MNPQHRLRLLQDSMYNATIRTDKPLSFFEAKDTVIKYAQKTFELNTDMKDVRYLPPETIAAINAAGYNDADISSFAQTHRYNNAQLRTVASLLMENSGLTIYEAEKEIRNVLAGEVSQYQPSLMILNARIHPIDLVHVFEKCHKDALHAMVTQVNIPLKEAFREVAITSNQMLAKYPEQISQAKVLIIAEVVEFFGMGRGNLDAAINHVMGISKLTEKDKSPRQIEIATIYPLFVKYVFSNKFKTELHEAISVGVVADAVKDTEEYNHEFTAASIQANQQTDSRIKPTGAAATITPHSDSFIAPGINQPILGTTALMASVRHVNDHAAVYGFSAALIVAVLYCTNKLHYLNPLTPINRMCSALTFWGRKKTQASKNDAYVPETGRQHSGTDTEDEENQRLTGERQRRGYSPHKR